MDLKIKEATDGRDPKEVTELHIDDCTEGSKLNLLREFKDLETLSVNNCGISTLKGFPTLPKLAKLELSSNKISGTLFFLHCPNLTHLNLSNNKIADVGPLKPLAKLKKLQSLVLANCGVTKVKNYRKKVFNMIKSLTDLDGEDKSVEESGAVEEVEMQSVDEEPMTEDQSDTKSEQKPSEREDGEKSNDCLIITGRKKSKRKSKSNDSSPSKRKRLEILPKNALMQLNELKPGLKYIIESQTGPSHNPEFVVSVEVNEQKYTGHGNSKQLAKHAAAQAALSSFVQFRNMPEAMSAISRPSNLSDFTTDNVENEGVSFNKFEGHKNGAENEIIATGMSSPKKSFKILTEADKKNPVMLLNEIHPGLTFELAEENSTVPSQRFRMTVEVDGQVYEGTGQNKKQAKASAARAVLSNLYNVSYSAYSSMLSETEGNAELFKFPQAVADRISKLLMTTFNEVMTSTPDYVKWKVIAGIVMTKDEDMQDIQVISFGTGTKCINGEHISMVGANLNDCHAEIISRRCLKDFLYTNLELYHEGEGDQSIFLKRDNGGFSLKPNIKFHLYISTAPCGDARIFSPHEEVIDPVDRHPNRNSRGVLRTKIESGEGTIPVRPGQCIQTWDGILPGQERLLTMSCSDKVAAWNVLGLQGALLSVFIEPIYLESVILGGLFHPNHLQRALFSRIESTLKDLPNMFKLNKPQMCAITSQETRHLVKSPSFSVNWTVGLGRAEIVNAINGKTEGGQTSRLAKRSFFQRFLILHKNLSSINTYDTPQTELYAAFKNMVKDYQEAKKSLFSSFADAGLGSWVKKPVEQNEFELTF